MTISTVNCSDNLKNELENMGYELVDFNSNTGCVDAILYKGHLSDAFGCSACSDSNGIFVINAEGKTSEEIDNILQKRLYSPIFFL